MIGSTSLAEEGLHGPPAPQPSGDYDQDAAAFTAFWRRSEAQIAELPRRWERTPEQARTADRIFSQARAARDAWLGLHVDALYDRLTGGRTRFVRVEDLVFAAAAAVPGLAPTPAQIAREADVLQRDKDGLEIDQGLLIAHVLASETAGRHLCHAMLLPRPESTDWLARLDRDGRADLGAACVWREGKAVHVELRNPRHLNAEDQTTIVQTEIAIDIATLDPATEIAVLRGGVVDNPKYAGRHIFGAGINLTHLYRGLIPYVWYMQRDLGLVHKLLRGTALPGSFPDDVVGAGVEKPWLAAVDTFAIGGHCQILLCMDYVLAARDVFMTLPARKEGIIPGAANMRLPRFTGDRIARQAVQYGRKLAADSAEGGLICDELADASDMDAAIARVVEGLTSSGAVSVVANRRAFRVVQEPLDTFRRYFAVYAREQAYCHFSPALISNLETHWNAANRSL